ncbi:MAG TPA: DUF4926 domain-containing protein [Candidatus Kapabacteria bacterium]|jgi:hypothetical protein
MQSQIKDLDVAALLENIPGKHLTHGETETVVFDFGDGVFWVELADNLGQTITSVASHGR